MNCSSSLLLSNTDAVTMWVVLISFAKGSACSISVNVLSFTWSNRDTTVSICSPMGAEGLAWSGSLPGPITTSRMRWLEYRERWRL